MHRFITKSLGTTKGIWSFQFNLYRVKLSALRTWEHKIKSLTYFIFGSKNVVKAPN
jgi:hypothetical protein